MRKMALVLGGFATAIAAAAAGAGSAGAADNETLPDHSRRVFDALAGPKHLILVDGAHHAQSLRADIWPQIDAWLGRVLETRSHL